MFSLMRAWSWRPSSWRPLQSSDAGKDQAAEERTAAPAATEPPALEPKVAERAALQKALRPAARIPLLRTPHGWWETWLVEASAADCVAGLERGLNELSASTGSGFVYRLDGVVRTPQYGMASARVLIFTKARWMDVADLRFKDKADGTCACSVRYFATGLLPLTLWGAPILNVALCWFPFWHMGLPRSTTLPAIRSAIGKSIQVQGKGYPL